MVVDDSFHKAGDHLIGMSVSRLAPSPEAAGRPLSLRLANHRGKPINLAISSNGDVFVRVVLYPGYTDLQIERSIPGRNWPSIADAWVPSVELGTTDGRLLSFHLVGAHYG